MESGLRLPIQCYTIVQNLTHLLKLVNEALVDSRTMRILYTTALKDTLNDGTQLQYFL